MSENRKMLGSGQKAPTFQTNAWLNDHQIDFENVVVIRVKKLSSHGALP